MDAGSLESRLCSSQTNSISILVVALRWVLYCPHFKDENLEAQGVRFERCESDSGPVTPRVPCFLCISSFIFDCPVPPLSGLRIGVGSSASPGEAEPRHQPLGVLVPQKCSLQ